MFQNYSSYLPGGSPTRSSNGQDNKDAGGGSGEKVRQADDDGEEVERVAYDSGPPSTSGKDGTAGMNRSVLSKELPNSTRLVAVRYFLDRPGYGLHNSAVRLWFNPPAQAQPQDVMDFLREQQIALDGLLVEVYLDRFQSFMMLEACSAACIEWEFGDTSPAKPGLVNVRLTDLGAALESEAAGAATLGGASTPAGFFPSQEKPSSAPPNGGGGGGRPLELANVSPLGLFAFSMTIGLECITFLFVLIPGSVSEYFVVVWAPYAFFVSGMLQFVVGLFETVRSNIYGATAFMAFGMFWMANGLTFILQNYFAVDGTLAQELLAEKSPWFSVVKNSYVLMFVLMLLVQTFAMNKLSTVLIALLSTKIFFSLFAPWSVGVLWVEFVLGWMTSFFAFYVFAVEFTNQVYHREVLPVYKWSEQNSPGEAFGARGKTGTLVSKATLLRQARFVSPRTLREAQAEATTTAVPSATTAPGQEENPEKLS
jgi:uncharacterized protein